jgi:DNA-binding transcriptional MerR regulator
MSDTTNDQAQTAGEAGSRTDTAGSAGQPPQAGASGERTFTQADLDRILENRLAEDRRKRDEAAKAQRAKDQGEWQAVAQQHESRVQELEPQLQRLTDELTEYRTLVQQETEARFKKLPKEVQEMKPSDDPRTLYTWLPKAEELAAKLAGQRTNGTPSGPSGTGAQPTAGTTPQDLIAEKRARIGTL